MDISKGTYSFSIPTETFGPEVSFLTKLIVNLKESSKNGKTWKPQEFMVVFKSVRSKNLSDNITDSVIFSNFSENHRKVRNIRNLLILWNLYQKMQNQYAYAILKLGFSCSVELFNLNHYLFSNIVFFSWKAGKV